MSSTLNICNFNVAAVCIKPVSESCICASSPTQTETNPLTLTVLCCDFCKCIQLHFGCLSCACLVLVLVFCCLEKRIYAILSSCQQYSTLVLNIFLLKTYDSLLYHPFFSFHLPHVLEQSSNLRNIRELCQKKTQTKFLSGAYYEFI